MRPLLILFLMACSATAALPYHPYRKVGDRYYNLLPLYSWEKLLHIPRNKLTPQQGEQRKNRPMPEWIGYEINSEGIAGYRVSRVLDDGVLVESTWTSLHSDVRSSSLIVLKNYPGEKKLVDGQRMDFFAMRVGIYRLGTKTYELYDYGIPYDPEQLKRAMQQTNGIPGTK
ncbi:MAG TPA: hypothetical protein VJA21_08380 [Verrucomicrobiae bacterium]